MKKLVFASAMALAAMGLVSASTLRAQDAGQGQGTIQISNPAEFNAYQQASTQTDPAAKAAALEQFLTQYPQSVVKKTVLDQLLDTYQQLNQADKALSAANRLLQIEPNNPKATLLSVFLDVAACKKNVDQKTGNLTDAQPCDNAAALSEKGLTAPKPQGMDDGQ
jgi:regulator of sirC expression with transglutaminase-like and TPR domain